VVVLLLRLGLLHFGERSGGTIQSWQYNAGPQTPPASPPRAASLPQRLQDLETMRAGGVISDAEYTARRQQIIASI
jgi:hypothetical protein